MILPIPDDPRFVLEAFDSADMQAWADAQRHNLHHHDGELIAHYSGLQCACANDNRLRRAVEWLERRGYVRRELGEDRLYRLRVLERPDRNHRTGPAFGGVQACPGVPEALHD